MKRVLILFFVLACVGWAQTVTNGPGYSSDAASTCYLTSAATTNSTNCKGSAANLYGVSIQNTTTTVYYLRLYNLSSAPTCNTSTGFVESIAIPPGASTGLVGGLIRAWPWPQGFSAGLGFCLTGGGGAADNTPAAAGVYVTLLFK